MTRLESADKSDYMRLMKYIMTKYGTSLHCNRFAVGNCNEYAIADLIEDLGYSVVRHQNAKRIDIEIPEFCKFSIKYSGGQNIKLHNSNNQANKDMSMCDTLLVTPKSWWFLRPSEIEALMIPLKEYLKNTVDGLELKSSILTQLKAKKYPYMFDFDISVDKAKCENMEINRIIYDVLKLKLAETSEARTLEPKTSEARTLEPKTPAAETPEAKTLASPLPETSPSS